MARAAVPVFTATGTATPLRHVTILRVKWLVISVMGCR
ncbi:hypothetical protein SAMN04489712_102152 [Thermomonospora echinospora]|uniref:Uncharacterized protein n=1 Tax=Thermomonospora echinospora TaxID=1992 RepID=A0A1H5V660_9ACTN|nr:hypothetical protein SAMN04489712_102152 [Thermomonospora echinospora]